MPLTRADILGRKMANAMHVDYSRRSSAWIGTVEGVPRLGVARGVENGAAFQRWYVDGKPLRDLELALAVLNGDKTLERAMAETEHPAPARKISIAAQLAEADYELAQRKLVYPRIASKTPSRRSELDMHTERMLAVRATLVWLADNEAVIKHRLGESG
jgi:hypothetical protein